MAGWFPVDRDIVSSDRWLAEKFTHGQALVDLYGLAQFAAAGHVRLKGVRIDLRRGQLAWSELGLSKRWRWSRGKVRRFLTELQTEQLLVQQTSNVTSVITMLKYDQHTASDTAAGTPKRTSNDTADGTANGTRIKKETIKQPPPTPSSATPSKQRSVWAEVAEELREQGLSRVEDAVATAQARNLSVEDVRELIAEWRENSGAWKVGALYQRLTGQLAAWPPVAPAFAREQSRRESVNNQARITTERLDGERRRLLDQERFELLDVKHADAIGAMSPAQVIAALGMPPLINAYQSRGLTKLVRERLFEVLESEPLAVESLAN